MSKASAETSERVSAARASRHVKQLVGQRMTITAIARRARTHKTTVRRLAASGSETTPLTISRDLEERLLAVKFDPASSPKGRYAAEDQIMLKALTWQGWDYGDLAAGIGVHKNTIWRIIGGQASITYAIHRRIKRFYASHWAFWGGSDRAHQRAVREGYDPPSEWDGRPVPHGAMAAYTRGCHCEDCRAANAKYKALSALRLLPGSEPDTSNAEPARLHVRGLLGQDMPLGAVAAKAGVSRHYLQRLVRGIDGHVTQTIPSDVDRRIRAVRYDPAFLPTGLRHPAGTERRLRGLVWMRWDPADIAAGTGLGAPLLERIIAGHAGHISSRVYEAVRRFYEVSWNRDGGSAAARDRAIAERFAPPSAWSEGAIDNPKAKPQGVDPRIYEPEAAG